MEPKVNVGILSAEKIEYELHSQYRLQGEIISGKQAVYIQNGHILFNGKMYHELVFEPVDEQSSFTLKNVVIGINFHWERKEDQQFRGSLKLIVRNNRITAINSIHVEEYLTSVISSEMSASASAELLKAHAVISRSWLLSQLEKNRSLTENKEKYCTSYTTEDEYIRWYDREDHTDFDVCSDDHCQRYQGITRLSSHIKAAREAINQTRGQVLKFEGEICDARFSKCCGGVTEEFQNCWEDVHYPYLSKLRDNNTDDIPDLSGEMEAEKWIREYSPAYCNTKDKSILSQVLNNYDQETTDFYRWRIEYTQDELSGLVKERSGIDFGTVRELIPLQRGTSGRIIKLKIVGAENTMTIGKELEIRRILSRSHLYSSAFIIDKKDGCFILTGAGWGHGVGLCQIGAAVMGEKGFGYDQILLHYYKGAYIENMY